MDIKEILNMENADSMESALFEAVGGNGVVFADLLRALQAFSLKVDPKRADSMAEMVEGGDKVAGNGTNLIAILWFRARMNTGSLEFKNQSRAKLEAAFADRPSLNMIKAAFVDGIDGAECIRRFHTLKSLKQGLYCYDKGWGFGIVKRVDDFYQKIVVDFVEKKDHQLTLGYAGETLAVLGKEHILVVNHENPGEIKRLIIEEPAKIVVMVLQSFGPMTIDQAKWTLAKTNILPETLWKDLWDRARPQLKKNSLVDIPASRNEPLKLILDAGKLAGDKVNSFKAVRDPKAILDFIDKSGREGISIDDDTLTTKLLYAMDAVRGKDPALMARLMSLAGAGTVKVSVEQVKVPAEWLMDTKVFVQAADGIPGKTLALVLKQLRIVNETKLLDTMLSAVDTASAQTIGECVALADSIGKSGTILEKIREQSLTKNPPKEMLIWVAQNLARAKSELNYNETAVLALIKMLVESDYEGIPARTRNAARRLFDDEEFVELLINGLSPDGKRECIGMLSGAMLWPESDRRGVLARIMKAHPEIKTIIEQHAAASQPVIKAAPRVTSYRSYKERSEYYQKLITVEIPKNSKDIAYARGLGDLRENHEYKSAKEHQTVLLRKKEELEADFEAVKAVDFDKADLSVAGPGTCVAVLRPSGETQTFCILGEFDRDEKLHIISSKSRLGLILSGKVAGTDVVLPDESGHKEETCKVTAITGLTEEIQQWIRG